MKRVRTTLATLTFALALGLSCITATPTRAAVAPQDVLATWYDMILELVRHTPTYSPPFASRSFAYISVTAYEAVASGADDMQSLSGQLNGLTPVPKRDPAMTYDDAVVLQAAMAQSAQDFFANTGPMGQRAIGAMMRKQRAKATDGLPQDVIENSEAYGRAVAGHVLAWSQGDNMPENGTMGFPDTYDGPQGPEFWVPTNNIKMQQNPLLPEWGQTRRFLASVQANCILPPPIAYSEDPASEFYKQAMEVHDATTTMTDDQRTLARFWSDDPLLTPTPAGHGMAIALQILARDKVDIKQSVDVLMRMGVGQADAMTEAWAGKYIYNRLRPITYIRRHIDPEWESLLITPPFPDYPSGHSVQSGTLAAIMTDLFGTGFAFVDATGEKDGLIPRSFKDFDEAGNEAGFSRLYGGIHYRNAIESGLAHGRCIGQQTNTLVTRSK